MDSNLIQDRVIREAIKRIEDKLKRIEDVYPLSQDASNADIVNAVNRICDSIKRRK